MTDARFDTYLRRLLHRWLVEYNPLYLASAALVLGGVTLLSLAMARAGNLHGQLGVTGIAELYAWALIGGAALLTRIGSRRPAVMLALLVVLYQGDLTLHCDTSRYLGWVGVVAAALWLASFVAKLYALCWAVRLCPSRSALALPSAAALGLAVIPRLLDPSDPATGTALVFGWLFALFAWGLWSHRSVQSEVELDAWGQVVLARSSRAAWAIWGVLAVFHALFWSYENGLEARVLLPMAALLATRWLRREALVWLATGLVLVWTGSMLPSFFWLVAAIAAGVLALHALRKPTRVEPAPEAAAPTPYRTAFAFHAQPPKARIEFVPGPSTSRLRLLSGTLFALYLSFWTMRWSGGPWPEHLLGLDLLLTACVLLFAWKPPARPALLALASSYVHFGAQVGIVALPTSLLGWGATAVSTGFALLGLSLLVSWSLRDRHSNSSA